MATYYVSTTGSDSNAGTLAAPFRTLAKLTSVCVNPGDIGYIRAGTYQERLATNANGAAGNPIRLAGYPGERPVIDGKYYSAGNTPDAGSIPSYQWDGLVQVGSTSPTNGQYVIISNLTVINSAGMGVRINGYHSAVDNVSVNKSYQTGIYIFGDYSGANNCQCTNACFSNVNGSGGGMWASGITAARNTNHNPRDTLYPYITNCLAYHIWGEGISAYEVTGAVVTGNVVHGCYAQNIYLSNATNCLLANNITYDLAGELTGWNFLFSLQDEPGYKSSANNIVINNLIDNTVGQKNRCRIYTNFQPNHLTNTILAYNTIVGDKFVYMPSFAAAPTDAVNTVRMNNLENAVVQGGTRGVPEYFIPTSRTTGAKITQATLTAAGCTLAIPPELLLDYYKNARPDPTQIGGIESAPAAGGSGNLAINKNATSSSNESTNTLPANAFDGNGATRWASTYSDPQWIQVDLGAAYNVNRVRILWEAAYSSSFKLQVSSDSTTWTDIYSTTSGTGGTQDLTGLSGSGRYVRMYGISRATVWGHSLWEMEVYGVGIVTVPNPGTQNGVVGTAATITISATDTAGGSITYTASGLPAGMTIDSVTGAIAGTPTTVGTGSVTVTATSSLGGVGTAVFTWTIADLTWVALPSPWQSADVNAGVAGASAYSGGIFRIDGSGINVWGTANGYRLAYLPVNGNFDISARVASTSGFGSYSKAGLILLSDLTSGSAFLSVNRMGAGTIEASRRDSAGGTAVSDAAVSTTDLWVRIVRNGNSISRYRSPTGAAGSWAALDAGQTTTIPTSATIALFVCSQDQTKTVRAMFDNVSAVTSSSIVGTGSMGGSGTLSVNSTFRKRVTGSATFYGSAVDAFQGNAIVYGSGSFQGSTTSAIFADNTNVHRSSAAFSGTASLDAHGVAVHQARVSVGGFDQIYVRGQQITISSATFSGLSDLLVEQTGTARSGTASFIGASSLHAVGSYTLSGYGRAAISALRQRRLHQYRVQQGDTLRALAYRLFHDATRWVEIAEINNLRPPHIIPSWLPEDRLSGTAVWGDTILLPRTIPQQSASQTELFGTDIALANGKLTATDSGDLSTLSGRDNIAQALRHRVKTAMSELVYHPQYGCNVQFALGLKAEPVINLMGGAWVYESLRQEPRISKINAVQATVTGDTLQVDCIVTMQGDNSPIDTNFVVP